MAPLHPDVIVLAAEHISHILYRGFSALLYIYCTSQPLLLTVSIYRNLGHQANQACPGAGARASTHT